MFYQSPFASPSAAPAAPPAFNEVTQALRQVTAGNSFQYMAETKKLCLAVCGAEEVASEMRTRGQAFESKKLFHQELQNQILAFALMRVLSDDVVKKAMQTAGGGVLVEPTGITSAAGRLARELEDAAGESEDMVKAVQESLLVQPLFRMANQMPEVFANLEQQYEQCAPYAAQLMKTLKASMGMLVTAAANAAATTMPPLSASTETAAAQPSAPEAPAAETPHETPQAQTPQAETPAPDAPAPEQGEPS